MKPLTILLLTHNRRKYTQWTLIALAEYTNWDCVEQVVVVDDNSVDGTRAEVKGRLRAQDVFVPVNVGNVAAAMWAGIQQVKTDYVIKLDNDVIVSQDWTWKALRKFQRIEKLFDILGYQRRTVYDVDYIPERIDDNVLPVPNTGGLFITRTDLIQESNFPDYTDSARFHGYEQWSQQYRLGMIYPQLDCPDIHRVPNIPDPQHGYTDRTDEPIIQDILRKDLTAIEQEYIANGWMREHD